MLFLSVVFALLAQGFLRFFQECLSEILQKKNNKRSGSFQNWDLNIHIMAEVYIKNIVHIEFFVKLNRGLDNIDKSNIAYNAVKELLF